MVQLKLAEDKKLYKSIIGFNSCMVQLKSRGQQRGRERRPRFNSCMVQLKWSHVKFISEKFTSF